MSEKDGILEMAEKLYDKLHTKKQLNIDGGFDSFMKNAPLKNRGIRLQEGVIAELKRIAGIEDTSIDALLNVFVQSEVGAYKRFEKTIAEEKEKWLKNFDAMSPEEKQRVLMEKKAEIFDLTSQGVLE
jgi:hypothetical protein